MTTTLGPGRATKDTDDDSGAGRPQDQTLVVPFAKARRADVATIGGKGANLGEMTAAGLPVPPGFVLTIDAYQRFYEDNDLAARVGEALSSLDADDPAALSRSARLLRDMIMRGRVSEALRSVVVQAYEELVKDGARDSRVAVRSSATAEDT